MSEEKRYKIDDGVLLASGLEEAFVGIGRRQGESDVAVYSIQKAIDTLVDQGATLEEAREYLENNSIGAWVGPLTPVWLETMTISEFFDEFPLKEVLHAPSWEEEVSIH